MSGPKPGSPGAQKIGEAHRGSHEHDKGGGFASAEGFARRAGKRGGAVTASRYGRDHWREMGEVGGATVLEKYGREHYVRIGQLGGRAKANAMRERRRAEGVAR